MINSRQKGARGERELAQFLRDHGYQARRGQQFSGSPDSPDVISDLDTIHWECKRTERGNPYDWIGQASDDCGDKMPVVAHRRNGKEWIAVLRLNDLMKLIAAGQAADDNPGENLSHLTPEQIVEKLSR